MAKIEVIPTAEAAVLAGFDAVIDARSPGEFATDHLPGAINLPVLSDEERAEVGTIYVQESRFKARRIGAAHVARNVARYLETALADKPGAFRPLVYCWRGGMRSNSMATILAEVGWRTGVLQGGYMTYRRAVTARLYEAEPQFRVVLLDGRTGSGKTEVLQRLARRGVQAIDLEGLAAHRGSLFGAIPGRPQPSQKLFETRLLHALDGIDPSRPLVLEAESSKIGERIIPPMLWKAMLQARRIELVAPPEGRARYLARAYRDIAEDRKELEAIFARLPTYPGRKRLEDWRALADQGAYEALALALMERHYDPAYQRSSGKDERPRAAQIAMADVEPASLEAAADEVARIVGSEV